MQPVSLLKLSVRGALAWCLLSILGLVAVRPIIGVFIPMMQSVIDLLQADYVSHLSVVDSPKGAEVLMSCTSTHALMVPGGAFMPPLRSFNCAWIDAVHVLTPLVMFLTPVLAWTAPRPRERLGRLVVCGLALPLVIALTTPVLLVGLAKQTLYPGSLITASPLSVGLEPFIVVEMGAGWLVALLAAAICIWAGGAIAVCAGQR